MDSAAGQHIRRGGSGFAIAAAKSAKGARREKSTMEYIMKLCDEVRETGFAFHRCSMGYLTTGPLGCRESAADEH